MSELKDLNKLTSDLMRDRSILRGIDELSDSAYVLEPREIYDDALIGSYTGNAVYCIDKVIECGIKEHDSYECSLEWHDFNTFSCHLGEFTPFS